MNIFVLNEDPEIAASMHCDQHLHKMILESAQMLSTVARYYCDPKADFSVLYKPTHENHPCNVWLRNEIENVKWLYMLAASLNFVRTSTLNSMPHKSFEVCTKVADLLKLKFYWLKFPEQYIFCGSDWISVRTDLTVPQRYQLYYKEKALEWSLKGKQMSYTNRPIPNFLKDNPHVISINK